MSIPMLAAGTAGIAVTLVAVCLLDWHFRRDRQARRRKELKAHIQQRLGE